VALSDVGRRILGARAFAHLAVNDTRGDPHVTPVWIDVDADGRPWINTIVGRAKERYLQEGTRIALSATDPDDPYVWLAVRGYVAERRLNGADEEIDLLSEKYRGPGQKSRRKPGEVRITIVIEPTSEHTGLPR
jgi:PPOX class probable F420-dependent enzyme